MSTSPDTNTKRAPRKFQRRLLVALAAIVTAVAFFYLEEDLRGKYEWEHFKSAKEASGFVLDWSRCIPSPVPDDQNFFTASSNILARFKKPQTDAESNALTHCDWLKITYTNNPFPVFENTNANGSPLLVASISVLPAAASGSHNNAFKFTDAEAPERMRSLIQKATGRAACGAVGFKFSERPLNKLVPGQIGLLSDSALSVADIAKLVPKDLDTNLGVFQIEAGKTEGAFQVLLTGVHVTTAKDYIKWSDQFAPALDEVREALKRPYALLTGDYSSPATVPIPAFQTYRTVVQLLAQRAQCYLLLGKPDAAVREMGLIPQICRTLKRIPAGKPLTLVESMINVAIAGLYADTLADGLRFHEWQEPQLAALQQQIKEFELMSAVVVSFQGEQVYSCNGMIRMDSADYRKLVWGKDSWSTKLHDPTYVFSTFAPRGWLYQNAMGHVSRSQFVVDAFNVPEQLVSPKGMDEHYQSENISKWNPYAYLEAIFMPNYSRATQRVAYNQTMINEALIACALERYHGKFGQYPEMLDALAPQFIDALPHDVIGGKPLHYRRTEGGKFLLYSVGWNEVDDGGKRGSESDPMKSIIEGDWVWQN